MYLIKACLILKDVENALYFLRVDCPLSKLHNILLKLKLNFCKDNIKTIILIN
jgi:hypothetical protein